MSSRRYIDIGVAAIMFAASRTFSGDTSITVPVVIPIAENPLKNVLRAFEYQSIFLILSMILFAAVFLTSSELIPVYVPGSFGTPRPAAFTRSLPRRTSKFRRSTGNLSGRALDADLVSDPYPLSLTVNFVSRRGGSSIWLLHHLRGRLCSRPTATWRCSCR